MISKNLIDINIEIFEKTILDLKEKFIDKNNNEPKILDDVKSINSIKENLKNVDEKDQ